MRLERPFLSYTRSFESSCKGPTAVKSAGIKKTSEPTTNTMTARRTWPGMYAVSLAAVCQESRIGSRVVFPGPVQ